MNKEPELPITITETLSLADDTIAIVEGTQGETTEELIENLSQDPNVEYVQPNYLYQIFSSPNDTYYSTLRGLPNIQRPATIQAFSGKNNTT
ncbi:MAG: hypothetical protein LBG59_01335 [Candidatus Peribacteria bacterium]|jgi:hypothetical protein|nr:hypothetical protein [Candidatus Peribacteria bacterium]